jgi:hypothetical protein
MTEHETQTEPKFALAVFANERTPQPERQLNLTWLQTSKLLTAPTERYTKSGKAFAPIKLNGTRANRNVENVSLAVIDSDQGVPFDEGKARFQGNATTIYTAHSHSEAHHEWRAVMPLETPVSSSDWSAYCAGLVDRFGPDIIDQQCKDPARIYYFHSHPKETAHLRRAEILEGILLDPAPLIERGRQILKQRKSPVSINHELESGINRALPETPENIERVKGMLSVLDAACDYGAWRNIGWALASLKWKCGFELFEQWSKTALTGRMRNER